MKKFYIPKYDYFNIQCTYISLFKSFRPKIVRYYKQYLLPSTNNRGFTKSNFSNLMEPPSQQPLPYDKIENYKVIIIGAVGSISRIYFITFFHRLVVVPKISPTLKCSYQFHLKACLQATFPSRMHQFYIVLSSANTFS